MPSSRPAAGRSDGLGAGAVGRSRQSESEREEEEDYVYAKVTQCAAPPGEKRPARRRARALLPLNERRQKHASPHAHTLAHCERGECISTEFLKS